MIQIKSVQCEYQDLWIRIMNFQHKSSHLWIDKSTSCRAQNLRQGIVIKTSFKTGFCGYQYFCYEISFYLVYSYSSFVSNLLNQNLQNVKTPKRKLKRVSFNDTLLNFGLRPYKSQKFNFLVHYSFS